jgi:predicted RNA-binding Zn-ribbon protein involved in translation (DUF1610 family)
MAEKPHISLIKQTPISRIRREYLQKFAIVLCCFAVGFAVLFTGFSYHLPSGILVAFFALFVAGSMVWFAFATLEFNCPRCGNNQIIDPNRPLRSWAWFMIFVNPVVCSNCHLNLSEPYDPGQMKLPPSNKGDVSL